MNNDAGENKYHIRNDLDLYHSFNRNELRMRNVMPGRVL